jgi:hypothetical protein
VQPAQAVGRTRKSNSASTVEGAVGASLRPHPKHSAAGIAAESAVGASRRPRSEQSDAGIVTESAVGASRRPRSERSTAQAQSRRRRATARRERTPRASDPQTASPRAKEGPRCSNAAPGNRCQAPGAEDTWGCKPPPPSLSSPQMARVHIDVRDSHGRIETRARAQPARVCVWSVPVGIVPARQATRVGVEPPGSPHAPTVACATRDRWRRSYSMGRSHKWQRHGIESLP